MKAQVKKYDPTQYNFENFANTMNKNYAIERSQNSQGGAFGAPTMPGNVAANANNPISLGSATNSQTLGNFGFNSILSGFKKSLDGFALGEQVSVDDKPPLPKSKGEETILLDEPTSSPDVSFGGGINSSALTTFLKDKIESPRSVNNVLKTNDTQSNTDASTPASTYRPENTAYNELIKMYESGITDIKELSKLIRRKYDTETVAAALDIFKTSYLPNVGKDTSGEGTGDGSGYLSWLDGIKITKTPDLTFEEWQSTYSVDPVQEYKYAQAQLDYEFKTWMSDYGARAEQLYQMGLSNSGVSDIYGANAYSAYIQSSMALKREQIKLQQENKRNYQTYLDEKKSAANTRIGTAYAAYEGSYTPEGSQGIYNSLIGQGMSASEAAEVIRRLDAHYNTMPEDSRPDVVAKNTVINTAYNNYAGVYYPGLEGAVRANLAAQNMSEEDINEVIRQLQAAYDATPDELKPDKVENSAKITEAFDWMLDQYNNSNGTINVEDLIKQVKALYGEDIGAQAAEKFMPFATVEEVDSATIVNDAAVRIATTIFTDTETGTSTYTGSESQKNYIRQLMQLAEYKDVAPYVEEIIAKMDENLKSTLDAVVEETVSTLEATADVYPETIVMSTLIGNLKDYKLQLAAGDITQEQYDQYARSFSDSAVKAYEWAVKSVNNMANAYAMFGFEEAEWAEMDDAQRESAIMDSMAKYRTEGLISESSYRSLVRNWIDTELAVFKEKGKNNAAATVLQDAGAIAQSVISWSLNKTDEEEFIEYIINSIGLVLRGEQLFWERGEKGAEATISFASPIKVVNRIEADDDLYNTLNSKKYTYTVDGLETAIAVYNGEIYKAYIDRNEIRHWDKCPANTLRVYGDGTSNTDFQKSGIYAMIAYLLERKNRDTRR